MKKMAIDVGGTEIKYCLIDEDLRMSGNGSVPTPHDTQEHFFSVLKDLYAPHAAETDGIAMSLPGFIDSERGTCNGGGAIVYNRNTSIAPELSALCGCPVHIANDGKCAAYAELQRGTLKGCSNAAVFIIGTGVGGGLIIDGKILNGQHYTAGEYSFLRTDYDHWDSEGAMMGNRCSTTGLLKRYRLAKGLGSGFPVNGKQFFKAYHEGEAEAIRVLDEFAEDVATALMNLTVLLDLEKIAIGGGISHDMTLVDRIRFAVNRVHTFSNGVIDSTLPKPEVVRCQFSGEANLVGAYLYMMQSSS